jgi:hypothetical protein
MVPSGNHVQCQHRRQHARPFDLFNDHRSNVEVFPGSMQYSKKRNVIFTTAGRAGAPLRVCFWTTQSQPLNASAVLEGQIA